MDVSELAITLIGPGAIGAALAAALLDGGHEPTIVARTPFERLKVEWPDGAVDAQVDCVTSASELAPADVVVVATKATHNRAITAELLASIKPGTVVLVAQNGVDHLDRFPDIASTGAVIVPAIPMLPADRTAPGRVSVGSPSRLVIPAGPSAPTVSSLFDDSFVDIEVTNDWKTAAWFKLVMNCASGGIGVLTRRGSAIYTDPQAQELLLGLMTEVVKVGQAHGAKLADDLPEQMQRYQISKAGGHTTSIVVDRLAGTPTEWRERNEVVVRTAELYGIDVPLNRVVTTLMRLGEPDFEPPQSPER